MNQRETAAAMAFVTAAMAAVSYTHLDVYKRQEKGKAFIYTATVAVKPEVTLGEYKGIEVEKAKPEVTDACLLYTSRCV